MLIKCEAVASSLEAANRRMKEDVKRVSTIPSLPCVHKMRRLILLMQLSVFGPIDAIDVGKDMKGKTLQA